MRLRSISLAAGLLAFAATGALPAGAVTGPSGTFVAVRTDKPPALDPLLKDPAWDKAVVASGLQTVTTQKPSPFDSRFMLLYDDANVYVGMTLKQGGAPVTATQSANGVGFGLDDFAGIGIDPSGNGGQVYFFMTTPRGTRYQQSTESARFAPPWTAGAETRRPPRFEVYGLASGGEDRRRFQAADGNFIVTGERHAGADVVVPITGTTSFVAAIAPDFSNVEIDQQTIAPQEFRRALNEYRPFFTQGANFFNPISLTGINAPPPVIFYSPAIGPFDRGLKLEGTQGLQSFGALEAQGAGFDDMVFGYKHAVPNRSFAWSLDGVMTHHQAGNETIDQRAGNDATWQAQVGGRNTNTGFVYALDYVREQGTFVTDKRLAYKTEDFIFVHPHTTEIYTAYRDLGPQYAPVLGFTQNADIRGPQSFFDINGTPKNGVLKRVDLFMTADRYVDRSGAAHQSDANVNVDLQFKDGLHLSGGPFLASLRTYDRGLIGYPFYTRGVTRSYNQNGVNAGWKEGTPAPYTAGFSWGPFGDMFLQQVSFATSRTIGTRWSIGGEIDGTRERPSFGAPADGQWLRRLTLGETIDANTNFSVSLRGISGTGGFAQPGVNLAASLHHRFKNDSELFFNYGTPAAPTTLQRVVLKYVLRTGGGSGT